MDPAAPVVDPAAPAVDPAAPAEEPPAAAAVGAPVVVQIQQPQFQELWDRPMRARYYKHQQAGGQHQHQACQGRRGQQRQQAHTLPQPLPQAGQDVA